MSRPLDSLLRKGGERRRPTPGRLEEDARGTPPPRCAPEARGHARTLAPATRPLVCVAGASSNAGKTWLCERLLEGFAAAGRPARALKVTRTHLDSCPRQNDGCGVCDDLDAAYRVVTDAATIDTPKKDTGRYVAAGATDVRWLIVDPAQVLSGITAALDEIGSGPLVAEGNAFLDNVDGIDMALMAVTDRFRVKPSALHVIDRVDAFVGSEEAEEALTPMLQDRGLHTPTWVRPDDIAAWVLAQT